MARSSFFVRHLSFSRDPLFFRQDSWQMRQQMGQNSRISSRSRVCALDLGSPEQFRWEAEGGEEQWVQEGRRIGNEQA